MLWKIINFFTDLFCLWSLLNTYFLLMNICHFVCVYVLFGCTGAGFAWIFACKLHIKFLRFTRILWAVFWFNTSTVGGPFSNQLRRLILKLWNIFKARHWCLKFPMDLKFVSNFKAVWASASMVLDPTKLEYSISNIRKVNMRCRGLLDVLGSISSTILYLFVCVGMCLNFKTLPKRPLRYILHTLPEMLKILVQIFLLVCHHHYFISASLSPNSSSNSRSPDEPRQTLVPATVLPSNQWSLHGNHARHHPGNHAPQGGKGGIYVTLVRQERNWERGANVWVNLLRWFFNCNLWW